MKRDAPGQHQEPHRRSASPASHGPYLSRAHRDWRVWVGAVLMVIALSVYVLSGDLGWLPGYQRHQAVSGATMH